jgi:HSP20 family molecular chaperone IbpA
MPNMKKQEQSTSGITYPGGYVPMVAIDHQSVSASAPRKSLELLPSPILKATPVGYELVIPVPGMRREDFQIDVKDNELTVYLFNQPQRRSNQPHFRDMSYEVAMRTVRLPDDADTAFTIAGYSAGVLTLSVPRSSAPVSSDCMPVVVY